MLENVCQNSDPYKSTATSIVGDDACDIPNLSAKSYPTAKQINSSVGYGDFS